MQDFENYASRTNGRWTKEEHLKFLQGLRIYGKNWKKIEQLVETRTGSQIRSHAQKFFLKTKQEGMTDSKEEERLSEECHDEPEDATVNSKSMCEWDGRREGLSYYLTKIMDYSSSRGHLDFWCALVDFKGATDNLNQSNRNSSFISFEEEENGEETLTHPSKKVQV